MASNFSIPINVPLMFFFHGFYPTDVEPLWIQLVILCYNAMMIMLNRGMLRTRRQLNTFTITTIIIVILNEFCTATVKQLTLSHCTWQHIDRFGLELS